VLQPRFLSNRNLFPLYNVACILRAFAIIQKEFPDASLVLAGNGSERANLERLAWELQLKNVTFTGLVAPSEMPKLYDEADIFLNSSNIDNMPGSILESFASGLPVITTDAGGIPYIVTHEKTGLLVPRGDHEALANAAIRLLKDPALAAAITDRAYAETGKYSWSAVRNDWLHLYERLGNGLQFSSRPVPHEEPL
jgi:glycosyltransferase involved in cell wall biosynthesis